LLIGAILAVAISLTFFMLQSFLIGAFFFLFAFQSFDAWRKSRFVTKEDREGGSQELLMRAEEALQAGKKEEAKRLLEEVRSGNQSGLAAITAAQYLAFLAVQEGKKDEAYELLLPIQHQLADDSRCILHELAAEHGNYPLVAQLSTACYQIAPSQKMALSNARAFAYQKEAQKAGGWLQTAWQFGEVDLVSILQEEVFQQVKEQPEFRKFTDPLK